VGAGPGERGRADARRRPGDAGGSDETVDLGSRVDHPGRLASLEAAGVVLCSARVLLNIRAGNINLTIGARNRGADERHAASGEAAAW